jgi:SulP family sulfate permease
MEYSLRPKLISILQEGYTKQQFFRDLAAGLIVGIVSFPMAIAFGIGSGVRPEQGLYTAIIAGFLTSLLGGSRVQIGGPTGAFVVLLSSLMATYGYDGLAVITLMAGLMLIFLGISRLGFLIKFIPYPVIVGFTSGIAVIIFSSQVADLFDLKISAVPGKFVAKWDAYIHNFHTANWYAFGLGILAIAIIVLWPRISQKIPGSLVAIIVTTGIASFLKMPVSTIGSRFGEIPNHLPLPHLPTIDWSQVPHFIQPAITVALLAGIESLLSAIVADGMLGSRHRSNMELFAHGIANIGSALFGGIPSTGAIARTATNIKNGGRTPIAGMISATTVLIIMLFVGKLIALIPMCTLSAVLIVVAYNMSEWRHFVTLFSSPKSDLLVLLITFLLTIFTDITKALEVGIVLAALLFVQRMAAATKIASLKESMIEEDNPYDPLNLALQTIPQEIEVFEIQGPFFFAATEKFKMALKRIDRYPKVLILHMYQVPAIDASGLRVLEDMLHKTRAEKTKLFISGASTETLRVMKKAGFIHHIGAGNMFKDLESALKAAQDFIAKPATSTNH